MQTTFEISTVPGVRRLHLLATASAIVCGTFCTAFVGLLLFNYHLPYRPDKLDAMQTPIPTATADGIPLAVSDPSYRIPATDPFNILPTDYKEFLDLKRRLAVDRTNEALKDEIRLLDQKLRLDYFKRRDTVRLASPFLLIAAVGFLISVRTAGALRREMPLPQGDQQAKVRKDDKQRLQLGTLSVACVSVGLVGVALGLLLVPASPFEQILRSKLAQETAAAPVPQSVSDPVGGAVEEKPLSREEFYAELQKNWPSFRGTTGSGISSAQNLPIKWDATTDENILWRTEIPLSGKSSPVIWDNRLFLTGADKEKRQVFCFNIDTGELLWHVDAPSTPESEAPFSVTEDTGYAAPTPVVDGRRVYALFANGDIVAADFDGKVVWSRSLGIPENSYGFASSPALYFDRLIVQYDYGDGSEGQSKLYAFDTKSGGIVWETPRELPNAWASPIVCQIGDKYQIITSSDPFVVAYDPEDGSEIWRCKCLFGDVGPSPTVIGNTVISTNVGPRTMAIDATGTDDVTKTNILWTGTNALPDTVSPIATEKNVYTLSSQGYLTCYDPSNIRNNRAMYWELEVGEGMANFYSSPLLAGDLLYLFDMTEAKPMAFVIDLSKAELDDRGSLIDESVMIAAANPMDAPIVASPAAIDGRLFIRSETTLFCIGEKNSPAAP